VYPSNSAWSNISINSTEDGLVNSYPSDPSLDLSVMFGLQRAAFADIGVKGYCGTGPIPYTSFGGGFTTGMTIGEFAALFPNYWYMLDTVLGWSDPQILGLTYFTACVNEATLLAYQASFGFPYQNRKIGIPAGNFWYNSELRVGQSIVQGQGGNGFSSFEQTTLSLTHTNWKSIYGTQNDNTYMGICPFTYNGEEGAALPPVGGISGGYCHGTQLRDLVMIGTKGEDEFNDYTYREVGFNYYAPGEVSGAQNCCFNGFNDFGVLIAGGGCAYGNLQGNSFFGNNVAGVGICGVARGTINMSFSGDYNPYAFWMYRASETNSSPNNLTNRTTTAASYVQPAVATNVAGVQVTDATYMKAGIGMPLHIAGGGYYTIIAKAVNTLTLRLDSIGSGDASVGATVTSGKVASMAYFYNTTTGNSGGNITMPYLKLECFTCSDHYVPSSGPAYAGCFAVGTNGKGQMLGRLAGRFHFFCMGGTATAEPGGVVNTLLRVDDDSDWGGIIQLLNSSIRVNELGTVGFNYWLHDTNADKKFLADPDDNDFHGNGFVWRKNQRLGLAYDCTDPSVALTAVAATYKFRQPFINAFRTGTDFYNESWAAPTFGYDGVTGHLWNGSFV
jgi:hypothetical protein